MLHQSYPQTYDKNLKVTQRTKGMGMGGGDLEKGGV